MYMYTYMCVYLYLYICSYISVSMHRWCTDVNPVAKALGKRHSFERIASSIR